MDHCFSVWSSISIPVFYIEIFVLEVTAVWITVIYSFEKKYQKEILKSPVHAYCLSCAGEPGTGHTIPYVASPLQSRGGGAAGGALPNAPQAF